MSKEEIKKETQEIKTEAKRASQEIKKEMQGQDPNVLAAIGYIWILFLVPLFLAGDNEFCKHHAKQGLVLFVFSLLVTVLGSIPVIGWLIIMPLGWIIVVVLMLLGIVNALRGEMWEMPYLGKFAKKINF